MKNNCQHARVKRHFCAKYLLAPEAFRVVSPAAEAPPRTHRRHQRPATATAHTRTPLTPLTPQGLWPQSADTVQQPVQHAVVLHTPCQRHRPQRTRGISGRVSGASRQRPVLRTHVGRRRWLCAVVWQDGVVGRAHAHHSLSLWRTKRSSWGKMEDECKLAHEHSVAHCSCVHVSRRAIHSWNRRQQVHVCMVAWSPANRVEAFCHRIIVSLAGFILVNCVFLTVYLGSCMP